MFAEALIGEEAEELVFDEGTADASAKLLAGVGRVLGLSGGGMLVEVEGLFAEEAEGGAVVVVGSGARDHVDRGAFRASVGSGETLR